MGPPAEPTEIVQQQETFAEDLDDEGFMPRRAAPEAERLFAKVREEGNSSFALHLTVRFAFETTTWGDQCREVSDEPSDLETDVYGAPPCCRDAGTESELRMVSLKLANVTAASSAQNFPWIATPNTRRPNGSARVWTDSSVSRR